MCYIQKDKFINNLIKNSEIESEVFHHNNNINDFDFLVEPKNEGLLHTFKVVLGLIAFGLMMSKILVIFFLI